ncbi:MAG: hypothetical protein HY429_02970, partial [Candidatus Levybacteria bacterium]|nr:hypothetical protein [Candidatus Levybacteria bacterium]
MPEKGVFPNLKDYSLIPNRDVRALLDRIDRTSSIEGSFHAYKLSTILARDLGWYMKLERIDFISLYDRVRTLGIIRFETEQIGKRVSYLATPDATRAFAVLAFVAKKESKNGRIARKAHNWPDIVEKTRAALGPHPLADLIYDPKPEPKRKGVVQTHDTAKVPKIRKKPGNEDDPWNYIDDKTNRMIPVFSEEEREELARWTPKIIAEGLASYRFRHFPSETVSA